MGKSGLENEREGLGYEDWAGYGERGDGWNGWNG
jgi:hypothetical protein